ncbi:MAG: enoyl-CoA hydratase-related protein [Actinomycetota bacterium]|nr:enoyl-CoA hydratase-related protein [Actinomycetota bacterium]
MTSTVLSDREGRVAILTINRPDKLNALNDQVRDELLEKLAEIADDDAVGVVVITGAGEKSFIAGADISEFAGRSPFDQRHAMRSPRIFDIMASFPKPVIAMINGFCLGGGCELALACTFRFAADTAHIGQPEINLGIIPGFGGTQRLPRLVGPSKALEMNTTGEAISAEQAYEHGLVNQVAADHELFDTALAWARKYSRQAPLALEQIKRVSHRGDLDEGIEAEKQGFAAVFASEDAREGIGAFLGKRTPDFRGE